MPSVALVLAGVLQSWGTTTLGNTRATNSYPTKSAVIGLIANAMGRSREDDISDLADMSYGVRIDAPGHIQRDYHTVRVLVQPTKGEYTSRITERFYLADAVFVVVLNSTDDVLVNAIAQALRKPERALFLGRKSCPPTRPVLYDVLDADIPTALAHIPWQADKSVKDNYLDTSIELDVARDPMNESEGSESDVIADQPLTFNQSARRYASRGVYRTTVTLVVGTKKVDSTIPMALQLAMSAESAEIQA